LARRSRPSHAGHPPPKKALLSGALRAQDRAADTCIEITSLFVDEHHISVYLGALTSFPFRHRTEQDAMV
jgi:hypothetical protein